MKPTIEELFERVITYPDFEYQDRLNELIGIDDYKQRLAKIIGLLINPSGIESWMDKFHAKSTSKTINFVLRRPPLVVLEGDVGSGKSELAVTIGDAVARNEKIDITLLPLSLSTRGEGRVGEMTRLISAAFDFTIEKAEKLRRDGKKSNGAVILLVDEADALGQSRENSQMHHEDRAGVNAFIRGIDRLGNGKLPAAVILCTNRLSAIDPAIKRRAADILKFKRPDKNLRIKVLEPVLHEFGLATEDITEIANLTGKINGHNYGFSFSDLTQRLIPAIILDAYPDKPVSGKRAIEIAKSIEPTPPFKDISE